MTAVPKDYMKWTTCFKVVQLDNPLHFLTHAQSRDRYKDTYTSQIHMLLSTHSKRWGAEGVGVGGYVQLQPTVTDAWNI